MAAVLNAYYQRKDLYGSITNGPKGHRNIARRAVEFHASHLWAGDLPDALPIETDHKDIVDPIYQVWEWSNFAVKKQVFARHLPLYGNAFIKIAGSRQKGRVWFELLDPRFVTSFDIDERGFLLTLRTDKQRPKDATYPRPYVLTEIWSKERGDHRIYKHEKGIAEPEQSLKGKLVFSQKLTDYGIDFLPIVHAPFQDDGDETRGGRGVGVFEPYLDDIDEACRVGSRRNEMLFRYDRNTWALLHDSKDPEGNPLPPGRFNISAEGVAVGSLGDSPDDPQPDTVELGNDKLIKLFGGGKLESLVPNIDWGAAKQADDDMINWLAEELPEVVYSQLKDKGDLSGRAIRLIMAAALDRAVEARGSGERAIVRADQMALTYAQKLGLPGFEVDTIGTFENKDFDHKFKERPVIPEDPADKAATDLARAQADQLRAITYGLPQSQLREEAGIEDVAPTGPNDTVIANQDAVQRIVAQLGANGQSSAAGNSQGNPRNSTG